MTSTPLLTASLKAVTRSILLSLGMDHSLIDFLAYTALGCATVLLAIFFVAVRVPHRRFSGRAKCLPSAKSKGSGAHLDLRNSVHVRRAQLAKSSATEI
jgi:hypothetical protein